MLSGKHGLDMAFFVTGMKSGVEAIFTTETPIDALTKFHVLYNRDYLKVRIISPRGQKISRDDLL
jgi:hypothetical protein